MKLKIFAFLDLVVVFPLVGSAIAAGVEEPVQDGEEDGPLDGELEAATLQQLLDHISTGEAATSLVIVARSSVFSSSGSVRASGRGFRSGHCCRRHLILLFSLST